MSGVWALTARGATTQHIETRELVRAVQKTQREQRRTEKPDPEAAGPEDKRAEPHWQAQLIETLIEIPPSAFERLCQRLLRESGFIQVEVTGRAGDGGIDGHGTIRLGGLISFNVLFQSKRYRGNLGPEVVRGFRGAIIGRADKGLISTTGGFTRDARKEATRDGASLIDLIDGELLAEKLKELRLGIDVEMVESVVVREDWFRAL